MCEGVCYSSALLASSDVASLSTAVRIEDFARGTAAHRVTTIGLTTATAAIYGSSVHA